MQLDMAIVLNMYNIILKVLNTTSSWALNTWLIYFYITTVFITICIRM